MRAGLGIGSLLTVLLGLVGAAFAHPGRNAFFPDGSTGEVPKYRGKAAQVLTVCKPNSKPPPPCSRAAAAPARCRARAAGR